ncbi:hypothetical protein ACKI10_43185 [Streptomyces galilaeus]|uniref:Uncharacterized protein n=1 Tax=Streptomyces galilaeus TaxID=33899 RepID=A0ABW9IXQ2_STRGJ
MSAIDEPRTAGVSGQSIHDSVQLSVDDATRATLPQTRYGDAVHAALAELVLLPDTLEAGMRIEGDSRPGRLALRELFLRLEWLPGHDDLVQAEASASGMTVQWSHLAGWSMTAAGDLVVLDADDLADPAVIAEAVMHAALCGLRCTCERSPGQGARWDQAVYLDIALGRYDERVDGVLG